MASQKNKERTYARNRKLSRKGNEKIYERDSTYLLKLVVVILLGTFWLKFSQPLHFFGLALNAVPIGLILGLFLVSRLEHFQFNRKIWYALLFVVTIVSYFLPAGIVI